MKFPFGDFVSRMMKSMAGASSRSGASTDPQPETTEIDLPVCHNPGDRPMTEVVDVIRLGPDRLQLLHSPGVIEGLARHDIIRPTDQHPQGFEVICRSGFLCVWFYFESPGVNRGPDGDHVREAVEKFGGIWDGGGNTHLIFSVPVRFGFPAIEKLFIDLSAQFPGSSWLFGNVYDPWNDFAPIGWWESMPPFSD